MSKLLLIIILMLSNVLCVFFFISLLRKENKMRVYAISLIGICSLTTTAYIVTLISTDMQVIRAAYGMYFVLMDMLCVALFYFIIVFTGKIHIKKTFWILSLVVFPDIISQIINIWTGHCVEYSAYGYGGEVFFHLTKHTLFYMHMSVCYLLVLVSEIHLFLRIVKSPKMYRFQYYVALVLGVIASTVNSLYMVSVIKVDISVICFAIAACLISYYTIEYLPKQLKLQMTGLLLKKMTTAVFLFDGFGSTVYVNEEGERQLGVPYNMSDAFSRMGFQPEDQRQNCEREIKHKDNGVVLVYRFSYRVMMDKNSRHDSGYLGSYIVMEDITKEREELILREYRASHDELTGVYNRSHFCEKAQEMILSHPEMNYCIVLTNIYQFRVYNEVFGKPAGDKLLIDLSQKFIQSSMGEHQVFGRYEADRFVFCIPMAWCTEDKMMKYPTLTPLQNEEFQAVSYVGICEIVDRSESIEQLCEYATIAMNTVKGDPDHQYAYYNHTMRDSLIREKELVALFPKALESGQIVPYIQPQFNQVTGRLVGGEVLTRWIGDDGTMISPGIFIPLLEKNGLITKLDHFIWGKAFAICSELKQMGIGMSLSVNLSAQDFFRCDIYRTFMDLKKQYHLDSEYIKLEITESEVLNNIDKKIELITALQKEGFIWEMDDFGSGYSSLNTLKDIPVDIIKMDMHFLDSSSHPEKGRKIIKTVAMLAGELGLPVITEGVENQGQADYLNTLGCYYVQGYLFGRPMPVDQFIELRKKIEFEQIHL